MIKKCLVTAHSGNKQISYTMLGTITSQKALSDAINAQVSESTHLHSTANLTRPNCKDNSASFSVGATTPRKDLFWSTNQSSSICSKTLVA